MAGGVDGPGAPTAADASAAADEAAFEEALMGFVVSRYATNTSIMMGEAKKQFSKVQENAKG